MADADESEGAGTGLSASEAFDVVGHSTRLDIIRALAEPRRTNWRWTGMSFADLRRAVGERDGGNFSYHLDELRDTFVVKEDDEYKLTYPGMEVAGAVVSGTYTGDAEGFSRETDIPCLGCGEPVVARFEGALLELVCDDHGVIFGTTLPPGAVDGRSAAEVVSLATTDARHEVERARSGACPHCWGQMAATLPGGDLVTDDDTVSPETSPGLDAEDIVSAEFACERCGLEFWLPVGACVLTEPAVVAFYHDHGVDVRERSYVELPFMGLTAPVVESEDPVRVRLDVELDGETLQVWLDDDTEVADTERVAAE